MSEHRRFVDRHGGRNSFLAYAPDELSEAWHINGQGHEQAVSRGAYCVVVPCSRREALELSALFVRRFAIPTCVSFDGTTISMYCGDAGSGASELLRDIWRLVGAYKADDLSIDEHGPLFAQK